ncbi:MAG: isopentenyl phosphate kinase family protein [Euryarchaeota archaeon]|nr:isopentenyl phosphate kinase family protein [Euryarchaeota archaeon]
MIILKLGGSLLTDKRRKFSFRAEVARRVAREIAESGQRLVVVHGGGSFGHPLAVEYGLDKGIAEEKQLRGVALTRQAMARFNLLVVEALLREGVNAVGVQTSAIALCEGRRLSRLELGTVRGFLELGLTPVLYGDVVLDSKQGVCILSGDTLVAELAREFKPERVVLAADVDGVFDRPPSQEGARLVREVNPKNWERVLGAVRRGEDATGGMRRKLEELIELARLGYSSVIVNALVEGRLKKALLGEEVKCTVVKGGDYP